MNHPRDDASDLLFRAAESRRLCAALRERNAAAGPDGSAQAGDA